MVPDIGRVDSVRLWDAADEHHRQGPNTLGAQDHDALDVARRRGTRVEDRVSGVMKVGVIAPPWTAFSKTPAPR